MNDLELMEIFKTKKKAAYEEFSLIFRKPFLFANVIPQIAASY